MSEDSAEQVESPSLTHLDPTEESDEGIVGCTDAAVVSNSAMRLHEGHLDRIFESISYLNDNVERVIVHLDQLSLALQKQGTNTSVSNDKPIVEPITCYYCKKLGHLGRNCRSRRRNARKKNAQAKSDNVVIGPLAGIDIVN